jgi:hypothetical protein
MKIKFLMRCKILLYNLIWRIIVIFFEIFRIILTIFLYPIMIISNKAFIKLQPYFIKDIIPKKK